jgi:hypothetical protein
MNRRPRRLVVLWSVAAVLLLGLDSGSAGAVQTASTSELKAAFVLNFVRFTEWPADVITGNGPVVVCLMDDTGVALAFQQISRGRTAGKREIEARWTRKDDALRACHVAYISGLDAKQSDDLVSRLQDTAVLTISDDERFAERGGIANFFIERDNMGFAVNVVALQRAKLQISAKLLLLARIVRR